LCLERVAALIEHGNPAPNGAKHVRTGKDFRIHSSGIDGSERVMSDGLPSGGRGFESLTYSHTRQAYPQQSCWHRGFQHAGADDRHPSLSVTLPAERIKKVRTAHSHEFFRWDGHFKIIDGTQ